MLLLVPFVWGTYGPSIKLLYDLPAPPPEIFFNWMTFAVSLSSLTLDTSGAERADVAEQSRPELRRATRNLPFRI